MGWGLAEFYERAGGDPPRTRARWPKLAAFADTRKDGHAPLVRGDGAQRLSRRRHPQRPRDDDLRGGAGEDPQGHAGADPRGGRCRRTSTPCAADRAGNLAVPRLLHRRPQPRSTSPRKAISTTMIRTAIRLGARPTGRLPRRLLGGGEGLRARRPRAGGRRAGAGGRHRGWSPTWRAARWRP